MINYKEQIVKSFKTFTNVVSSFVDIQFQCDLNDKLDHCQNRLVQHVQHFRLDFVFITF